MIISIFHEDFSMSKKPKQTTEETLAIKIELKPVIKSLEPIKPFYFGNLLVSRFKSDKYTIEELDQSFQIHETNQPNRYLTIPKSLCVVEYSNN